MNTQEIQGRWDQIRGKVKEKWGALTDDDLKIVGGNVDQVVGRIQQKTGEARRNVEQFLDQLVGEENRTKAFETVASAGQAVLSTAREGAEQVSQYARQGYERAGEVVQRHPASSMATVFGVGFLTGLVLGMLMSSEA